LEVPPLFDAVLSDHETLDGFDLDDRRCAACGHQAMAFDLTYVKANEALFLAFAFLHRRKRTEQAALNPPAGSVSLSVTIPPTSALVWASACVAGNAANAVNPAMVVACMRVFGMDHPPDLKPSEIREALLFPDRDALDRFDLDDRRGATRCDEPEAFDTADVKAVEAHLLGLAAPHPRPSAQELALNPPWLARPAGIGEFQGDDSADLRLSKGALGQQAKRCCHAHDGEQKLTVS
jgi:hypothetical protein